MIVLPEYRDFLSLTEEEIKFILTELFHPIKIENIFRSEDFNEIYADITTDGWESFNDDGNKVGIIGRLKHVLAGDEKFYVKKPYSNDYSPRTPQLTRNLNWKGGGAFKYYELEQYEDSLSKASYNEKTTLDLFDENIYNQYTFFADKKMLANFDITKDGHINIKLDKLFKNIDLPETISNILGLPIKKITKDKVIMLDDQKEITEKYDYNNMTEEEKQHFFNLLKPYLWWGE